MPSNREILSTIKDSFATYLEVGTSRSPAKLKILHGKIAKDIQEALGRNFTILSQGYGEDKEIYVEGRYYPKRVDITVKYEGHPVAAFGVKFVMRNYSQNSNNYYENMLGETANLRANHIPYFQIFIIFDKVPYYKKGGEFSKYDNFSEHHIEKYIKLSHDNPDTSIHTPDKTLIMVLNLKEKSPNYRFISEQDYAEYYSTHINDNELITYSNEITNNFGEGVILNDYEDFISKSKSIILAKINA